MGLASRPRVNAHGRSRNDGPAEGAMNRTLVGWAVLVSVLGALLTSCANDQPIHLWLRDSDRAVRHMTLTGHRASGELSPPPADEFANYFERQTYVELTSIVDGGAIYYMHLTLPRDVLNDPTF